MSGPPNTPGEWSNATFAWPTPHEQPYGRATALSRSLNPGIPLDRLPYMVAITAHFDESGSNDADLGGIMTLAGWVGLPSCWDAFDHKWKTMVANAPHPVKEFKACDLFHGNNEFSSKRGWTEAERFGFLDRACTIIEDKDPEMVKIGAVGCTIAERLLFPTGTAGIGQDELWEMAFLNILLLPFELFNGHKWESGDHRVNFVFDERKSVRSMVDRYFYRARARLSPEGRRIIGGVSFVDSVQYPAVQAADFLAYERRLQTLYRITNDKRYGRKSYQRLKKSRPGRFKILDDRFRDMATEAFNRWVAGDPAPALIDRIPYESD